MSASGPWPVVLGPADRTSFFREQARRRRQAGRYLALADIATLVLGIPLSLFLAPVIYLILAAAARVTNAVLPVSPELIATLRDIAAYVPGFFASSTSTDASAATVLLTIGALLAPGMIATFALWRLLYRLFEEAGTGAALMHLDARTPRTAELGERQLASNIVEMAITGGVPPPDVRLVDSDLSNAVVIGVDSEHATVILTRGLLDRLDRAETQAVVAHLIASAGNGDLRTGLATTTLFQAFALLFTTFDAAFNLSRSAARDLARFARRAVSPILPGDAAASIEIARWLDRPIAAARDDGLTAVQRDAVRESPRIRFGRAVRTFPPLLIALLPLLPLRIVFFFARVQLFLVRAFVIGPMLMLVYRRRRYHADAAAIQLTRNPDALAGALRRLVREGAVVPGGQWFSHLFIVGPEAAGHPAPARELGGVASHPTIAHRLRRIARMSARLRDDRSTSRQAATGTARGAAVAGALARPRSTGSRVAAMLAAARAFVSVLLIAAGVIAGIGLVLGSTLIYINAVFAIVRLILL